MIMKDSEILIFVDAQRHVGRLKLAIQGSSAVMKSRRSATSAASTRISLKSTASFARPVYEASVGRSGALMCDIPSKLAFTAIYNDQGCRDPF